MWVSQQAANPNALQLPSLQAIHFWSAFPCGLNEIIWVKGSAHVWHSNSEQEQQPQSHDILGSNNPDKIRKYMRNTWEARCSAPLWSLGNIPGYSLSFWVFQISHRFLSYVFYLFTLSAQATQPRDRDPEMDHSGPKTTQDMFWAPFNSWISSGTWTSTIVG